MAEPEMMIRGITFVDAVVTSLMIGNLLRCLCKAHMSYYVLIQSLQGEGVTEDNYEERYKEFKDLLLKVWIMIGPKLLIYSITVAASIKIAFIDFTRINMTDKLKLASQWLLVHTISMIVDESLWQQGDRNVLCMTAIVGFITVFLYFRREWRAADDPNLGFSLMSQYEKIMRVIAIIDVAAYLLLTFALFHFNRTNWKMAFEILMGRYTWPFYICKLISSGVVAYSYSPNMKESVGKTVTAVVWFGSHFIYVGWAIYRDVVIYKEDFPWSRLLAIDIIGMLVLSIYFARKVPMLISKVGLWILKIFDGIREN